MGAAGEDVWRGDGSNLRAGTGGWRWDRTGSQGQGRMSRRRWRVERILGDEGEDSPERRTEEPEREGLICGGCLGGRNKQSFLPGPGPGGSPCLHPVSEARGWPTEGVVLSN